MAYQLDGRMLEVCSCETICPCSVAEKPDGGICEVRVAWHIAVSYIHLTLPTNRDLQISVLSHLITNATAFFPVILYAQ